LQSIPSPAKNTPVVNYQPRKPAETLKDKIKLYFVKEGPYILRNIIRFMADIISWLIKYLVSLVRYFGEVIKNSFH